MTKTADTAAKAADKTAKTTAAEAKTYFDQVRESLESMQSKIEVPAAARDFVAKSAATAKERAESAHVGAGKFTDKAEKLTVSLVGGYANFLRGLLDATYANVQHGLETVEKIAAAKSVGEAAQIQADYVRESAKANFERVRDAADTARTAFVDGAKTVQAEMSEFYAITKAA